MEEGTAPCVTPTITRCETALQLAQGVEEGTPRRRATARICTAITAVLRPTRGRSATRRSPEHLHGKGGKDHKTGSDPIGHLVVGASARMTVHPVTLAGTGERREVAAMVRDAGSAIRRTQRNAHDRSNGNHRHRHRRTRQQRHTQCHQS